MKLDDTLNVGTKFIITYRPFTHNGEERQKLKDGKRTRQVTRRAKWDEKCKIVRDTLTNKIRYMTYWDIEASPDQNGNQYRCATGQIWITGGLE